MRRTTSAALAVLAFTTAGAARAQTYALDFARRGGAGACPSREVFVEQVGKRLGRDPFVGSSTKRFSVELSGGAGRWRGVMSVSAAGTQRGRQVIESSEADCTALFGAVVAAATVMLQSPQGDEPAAEKPAAPTVPAPSPEPAAPAEPSAPQPAKATVAVPASRPAPEPRPARATAEFDRFTLGVELIQDLALIPGTTRRAAAARRTATPATTRARTVASTAFRGPVLATRLRAGSIGAHRLLVLFSSGAGPRFALDARVGGAFGDAGPGFPPWHVELGARHWLGGPAAAVRGYVGASAGYARVDVKMPVTLRDCAATGTPSAACLDGNAPNQPVTVDAVDRLGPLFVAGRVGFAWTFAAHNSLGLALAASVPFPRARLVLWPSIAYSVGL